MRRTQSGITLIGFILVMAVAGVFIYVGMKVIPMYSEYYSVKQALEGIAKEPGIRDQTPDRIRELFFRRLYVSYSENVKDRDVKIVRSAMGQRIEVKYEVRRPLIANLDVVGNFEASKELTNAGIGN